MKLRIVGLRVLHVVEQICNGHNCDFKYVPEVGEQYEVLLKTLTDPERDWQKPQPYVLHLSTETGSCGSGWTTASWSKSRITKVKNLGPVTHREAMARTSANSGWDPSFVNVVDLDPKDLPEKFECSHFGWSGDGGCGYYPTGHAWVNMEGFESTGRGREKPLIHVFMGESGIGKTTLGNALSDEIGVYETDSSRDFGEEMLYARVIVLGEKYPEQTLNGIRGFFLGRELDVDIVPVKFGDSVKF